MVYTGDKQDAAGQEDDDRLREFFLVLRDALLMVVRWIERRYMGRKPNSKT